jgi:phenylacetate-coenzyme A ligase PaaK-like adenylate-forming protein
MTGLGWRDFRDDVVGALNADLFEQFGRRTWCAQRIHQTQSQGLRALLSYAIEHSPFHRRRLSGIDLTDLDPSDLSRLPIMTKAQMMEALDEVFTDRRLHRRDVESALAATRDRPVPILGDFVALATGGCSGHRGTFVYDRAGITTFMSAVARPPLDAQPNPAAGPPRIAMVTAPTPVHATGLTIALTAGSDAPVQTDALPATLPIDVIVERLNALQPAELSGYATMLVRLAAEANAGRLRISPTQVHSTSETLLPEMRSAVREAFGVSVFDGFGSTEGLFGKTGPDNDVFTFNTDMCIVELVDADNRPVPPGVPSAKVLITNLYNCVQPLIRYELTDAFDRQPDSTQHGYLRARVHGRSDETLRYRTATIHPITIRSVLVRTPEVVDYQIRQTVGGIDVFAVGSGNLDLDALTGRLCHALADAGLSRPVVTVHPVDRLERHRVSGKIRRIVPLPASHSHIALADSAR